jgi:biopolymer transport protein ExbD
MSRRSLPEINAGSMADIAFLLLIFFLVTTTMDVDTGLVRKLPAMPEDEEIIDDSQIKAKNIYVVLVNAKDQLLVEEELMDISQLREGAKTFLDNRGKNPTLSDNPQKAIISLQNDRGTSYEMYIKVQNELSAAYRELRDREAQKKFGVNYTELKGDNKKEIRKMYPEKISEAEPKNVGGK